MPAPRVIIARRADHCRECSGDIAAGEKINYGGPGAVSHERCRALAAVGRARSSRGWRAAGWREVGRGRCEDAPCCGCCD